MIPKLEEVYIICYLRCEEQNREYAELHGILLAGTKLSLWRHFPDAKGAEPVLYSGWLEKSVDNECLHLAP